MHFLRIVAQSALVLLPCLLIVHAGVLDRLLSQLGSFNGRSRGSTRLPEVIEDPASLLSSPRSPHGDGFAESLRPTTSHFGPSELVHADHHRPQLAQLPESLQNLDKQGLFTDIPIEDGLRITEFNLPEEVREIAFQKFDVNREIYISVRDGHGPTPLGELLDKSDRYTVELARWRKRAPIEGEQDPVLFRGSQNLEAVKGLAWKAHQEAQEGSYDAERAKELAESAALHAEQALEAYRGSNALVQAFHFAWKHNRPAPSRTYVVAGDLQAAFRDAFFKAMRNAEAVFPAHQQRFSQLSKEMSEAGSVGLYGSFDTALYGRRGVHPPHHRRATLT